MFVCVLSASPLLIQPNPYRTATPFWTNTSTPAPANTRPAGSRPTKNCYRKLKLRIYCRASIKLLPRA